MRWYSSGITAATNTFPSSSSHSQLLLSSSNTVIARPDFNQSISILQNLHYRAVLSIFPLSRCLIHVNDDGTPRPKSVWFVQLPGRRSLSHRFEISIVKSWELCLWEFHLGSMDLGGVTDRSQGNENRQESIESWCARETGRERHPRHFAREPFRLAGICDVKIDSGGITQDMNRIALNGNDNRSCGRSHKAHSKRFSFVTKSPVVLVWAHSCRCRWHNLGSVWWHLPMVRKQHRKSKYQAFQTPFKNLTRIVQLFSQRNFNSHSISWAGTFMYAICIHFADCLSKSIIAWFCLLSNWPTATNRTTILPYGTVRCRNRFYQSVLIDG